MDKRMAKNLVVLLLIIVCTESKSNKNSKKHGRIFREHFSLVQQSKYSNKAEPCACSEPQEIVMHDNNFYVDLFPTSNATGSYCIPMNCTWKVVNNFTDPNMLMLYAIGMLALRENSNDYIEVRIPDVNFTKRYTWKDNGFYEGGYNVVGKETYYIDFVTDNQFNGTSIESAWWIALNTDYKSCDCGIPSVMYFYNSELEYIIQTTADLIDLQPNYCVPMTCTWKIVNLLNNAPINVSALTLLLRNNTSDYIEAISNTNDVLFRLNYTNNAQILQFNITASEFNITFSTGNPLTSEEGIPPAWALDIKPVVQESSMLTTTGPSTTQGPLCECFGPFELSLTQFQQNLRIWPTYQEYYCYNMNCTWKITNEWTYDNAIVDLQIWEIYLRNNSKDYLQAYLPNGEVLFKLTYLDDCFGDCYSPFYDYKINAKEFYINFATGEPPEYPPPLNLTHGYFSVIANTEFQNCDCSVPSVYFFNYEEDFFQIGFDYQSYYCPSMDCTWKFINGYYGIYTIDVWNVIYHGIINSIALRNSSGDYIEARADDGRLIFRIDGSMSFGNLSYLIDDKIFNITFHSSNMSQTGVLPFWTLYMNPTNYVVAPSSYVTAAPTSNASSTSTPFLESTTKTATSITAMMKTIILSIMLQFIFLKDGF